MSCFPSGPLPKREPVVLDAQGRSPHDMHIGIAAFDALTKSTKFMFHPGPLVTLTDDPPRADASLRWKFREGAIADVPGMDWFADTTETP